MTSRRQGAPGLYWALKIWSSSASGRTGRAPQEPAAPVAARVKIAKAIGSRVIFVRGIGIQSR